ncbi:MAG: FAD-binding protein [Armatimonadetes bacterium]|nr:FAD-binding protein [Armatimonadota bacterium]
MAASQAIAEFIKALGKEKVLTDREDLLCYSYDATPDVPGALPEAVVMPENTAEVAQVIKIAGRYRVPVYPRGAGTNLSGGTVPVRGGIVLSLLKMNKILEIDADNLIAVVQPGVVNQALNDALAPYGVFYPPDPGSAATATMGGNVAECSGGLRGLKYGVTKDYVQGLEVVLADGTVVRLGGKTVKNVAGYDLVKLFVGSEGTLGIITEITVRLLPVPESRCSMLAVFADLEAAGNAVSDIIRHKVIPATLEILDKVTIRTVEDYLHIGLPVEAEAILLVETDGIKEVVEKEKEVLRRVLEKHGALVRIAAGEQERDQLWAGRRAALPALARVKPTTVLEDATVPRSQVTRMLAAIREIGQKYNVLIGNFGHAGDGNLHPTILTDARNEEEMERVHRAVEEIFKKALELGGTLSGEHGIGLAKKRFLPWQVGPEGLALMKKIKRALDPLNILNPGKFVDSADLDENGEKREGEGETGR